jgi:itaconate CoA-transferase
MTLPLTGVMVVSLEQAVAAPLCTCRLADAGARVIKVERPEGDFARYYDRLAAGESAYFVWLNRGKESICLDLTLADDKALFASMLAKADVLVQNLKPGAIAKLGFPLDGLRKLHPRARHLLHLRLWRGGALRRAQSLRPAHTGRIRPCVGDRLP